MKSMTGYGKATANIDGRELTVELKSVNHRFLDLNIKLPRIFNAFEDNIRKILGSYISRGHIDVYMYYTDKLQRTKTIEIDTLLATKLVDISQSLSQQFKLSNDFQTNALMKYPDVITVGMNDDDPDILARLINDAIKEAVVQLDLMRVKEGQKMEDDIVSRLVSIKKMVDEINTYAPQIIEDYKAKLTVRITEALADVKIDDGKLANEIAFFVDKANIDEEITRLYSHIAHTRDIISSNEQIGRKLDFIVQEFNREANTICSKCNCVAVTNIGLSLKNEIEKVREQVQNIE